MNRKMVFYMLGKMLLAEAAMLLLPLTVALYYNEACTSAFLASIAIILVLALPAAVFFKPSNKVIYAKEGFVITALSWLLLSAAGALPFYISGEISSFTDAFFETVSGFTTTGASILTDVEAMSRSLLFWRSFTHWIGGMGVLVFLMAIMTNISDRSMHIMRAEMPGPIVDKLLPRTRDTAKILYLIYLGMTALEIIFLVCGKMSLFDAIVHTFGTAGTGGFGIKADSIAGYSPYLQWVITVFMFLFGVNFNAYYLLLIKRFRAAIKNSEIWAYTAIMCVSTAVITANIYPLYNNFATALRHSAFQVSSIMTTTGYSTADFDLWPELSKTVLVILMFIGACAGSTGGGIKVSRIIIYIKMIRREFSRLLHPRSISIIRLDGKKLEEETIETQGSYLAVYSLCFFSVFLLLSFDRFDMETNFTAAAACFNNIGPGLSKVGPTLSFAGYSVVSKLALSFSMLLGRLEIFPLLLAFTPATWVKK